MKENAFEMCLIYERGLGHGVILTHLCKCGIFCSGGELYGKKEYGKGKIEH